MGLMPDEPKARGGPEARGPFTPRVYVPPPKEEAGAPFTAEPVVTEGMKARRREMSKRRREKALAELEKEETRSETWQRARNVLLKVAVAALVVLGYWRLQVQYPDDRWPLELVWVMMVVGLFGAFGWTLWYLNKAD
jgi:hypothetical protein